MRFDTRLVHKGQSSQPVTGDVVPPIHIATTFDRSPQDPVTRFYGRGENPTREALESCLAALEDAPFALTFSSGQAAAASVLSLLPTGSRVVSSDDVYGGTYALFQTLGRLGIEVDYVDLADPARRDAAITGDVAMVWVETPSNPLLRVTDIAAVSARASAIGALVVVDNTFATPVSQQPLALGAQLSLYSTTKFISGHSDVLGGALVYRDPSLHERLLAHRSVTGAVPGALDCYLMHRGLKTLSLRFARQSANAASVVESLADSPFAGAVHYPGLGDHPQHDVATRQMSSKGAMVSFEYLGDPDALLGSTRLFGAAVSLGAVRSLIALPASMSHRAIPRADLVRRGVTDNLVRLSFGIEDPTDLIDDLSAAMRAGMHRHRARKELIDHDRAGGT